MKPKLLAAGCSAILVLASLVGCEKPPPAQTSQSPSAKVPEAGRPANTAAKAREGDANDSGLEKNATAQVSTHTQEPPKDNVPETATRAPGDKDAGPLPFEPADLAEVELSALLKELKETSQRLPKTVTEIFDEGKLEGSYVVGKYANRPDAYELYARMHLVAGEYLAAKDAWLAALRVHPGFGYAHFGLGQVAARQGDFEHAAACYERAIEVMPEYAEASLELATTYSRLGQFEKAQSLLKDRVEAHADDGAAWVYLGQSYLAAGDFKQASDAFHSALSILPESRKALQGAAVAYARLKKVEQAQETKMRLVALHQKQRMEERADRQQVDDLEVYASELAEKLTTCGAFYMSQRDFENAERTLLRAGELAPNSLPPRQQLVRLYIGLGAAEPAARVFEEMIKIEPSRLEHRMDYAMVLGRLSRLAEMLEVYEECVKLERSAETLSMLAQAYHQVGSKDKAVATLDEAIAVNSNATELVRVREAWVNER